MDIFSLPDVFLRELMRTVEIKDRLRLRLTCRAFEKLVSETNAGFFDSAYISSWTPDRFTMTIGEALFFGIDWSKDGVEQRLRLMRRLFSGVTVGEFDFNIDDDLKALEFVRKLVAKFKIGTLGFRVQSEAQLENSLRLMADFPNSKYTMDLCFLPETDNLLSLPPMDEMSIFSRNEISSKLFIKLLHIHTNLDLGDMTISSDDLKKAVQVVSADARDRKIRLKVKCFNVVDCLRDFDISEASKAGDCCNEASYLSSSRNDTAVSSFHTLSLFHLTGKRFAIIRVNKIHKRLDLRFKNCTLELSRFAWTIADWNVDLLIYNGDKGNWKEL